MRLVNEGHIKYPAATEIALVINRIKFFMYSGMQILLNIDNKEID